MPHAQDSPNMQLIRTCYSHLQTYHIFAAHTQMYTCTIPRHWHTHSNQHIHSANTQSWGRGHPDLFLGPVTKARKEDGAVGCMPGGAGTFVLQRPRCTIVKDLIHMIQYELNHHLLDPDSEEGCISIATSGFDFFGPKSRKRHIQLGESALER